MELQYRGIRYTPSTTATETTALPATGMYRGQEVSFQTAEPQPIITEELTYRGVTYNPRQAEKAVNSRLFLQQRLTRWNPAFRPC